MLYARITSSSDWIQDTIRKVGYPDILHQVVVSILDGAACTTLYSNYGVSVTGTMLCVHDNRSSGVCFGDGDGPLVCKKSDGRWYLAGITSWIMGECASPYLPSGFARVTAARDWIDLFMEN
ncbi:chymotrypsinogen B-like [Saccoglossus kowalevskii]|uniref:Transmembrane protease serine 9-like n=1 Tax=Saccoglossus kowalevskii TaxID=10224 RepID=A0ABM0LVK1_SACKO|nr:PREDICTED: transmembrane protease serine 9-like [Saccoglossus kowalevskii]